MKVKKIGMVGVILLLIFSGSSSFSLASQPGTTAANFLKIPVGARASAMGGAYTALCQDTTALYWNPAGLVSCEEKELFAMYNSWFQDISQGYFGAVYPREKRAFGFAINYVDFGQMKRTTWENPTGTGEKFNATDICVSLGYGWRISSSLQTGIAIGYLKDTIAENEKSTFLFNFGVQNKISKNLSLGIAFQNLGGKLGDDLLPLTIRGGVAWTHSSLTTEVDLELPNDNDARIRTGFEWQLTPRLALRAGYQGDQDQGSGITLGLGLSTKKFAMDYTYVPFGDLGNTSRVSFVIRW